LRGLLYVGTQDGGETAAERAVSPGHSKTFQGVKEHNNILVHKMKTQEDAQNHSIGLFAALRFGTERTMFGRGSPSNMASVYSVKIVGQFVFWKVLELPAKSSPSLLSAHNTIFKD
jgi:hypothetical protein